MIRRFARPYARAIMDVCGSPQVAEALRTELTRFDEARRSSSDLRDLYANPGIDAAAKLAVTATIAKRLGLTELAVKVLDVLLRNHRLNDLDGILAALAARINQATGTLVAEVRTAHQLTPPEIQKLQSTLEKKFAKRIELQLATDPDLLGGFVAKVGSAIYDASVAGKIAKFRASLS
ncbi:MAG TPA: ATP synthase F1 subunit delta [Thermoanaerobaculia bacterium]|nr:ATP synthase F1 subunit delta [Thermoanaerobaculia bacterium]